MHIVNAMFAKGGGGIEQAFIDYCEGLKNRGHKVTALIQPGAWAEGKLHALGIEIVAIRNFNEWDIFAAWRIKRALLSLAPDVVIGVGGYASGPAMLSAVIKHIPTLAFEPNVVPGFANRIVAKFVSAAAVHSLRTTASQPAVHTAAMAAAPARNCIQRPA